MFKIEIKSNTARGSFMKYLLVLLFLTGCSHKILVKHCEPTDTEYSVCDTLNLLGK